MIQQQIIINTKTRDIMRRSTTFKICVTSLMNDPVEKYGIDLLQAIVEALEERFVRELNQQEVDESHCAEKQALDENWQPGFRGGRKCYSFVVL